MDKEGGDKNLEWLDPCIRVEGGDIGGRRREGRMSCKYRMRRKLITSAIIISWSSNLGS